MWRQKRDLKKGEGKEWSWFRGEEINDKSGGGGERGWGEGLRNEAKDQIEKRESTINLWSFLN